jgi:predicted proteasome-type protease
MTPKEKAAELIVNYQLKCKSLNYDEANQCALIAVDEIIKSCIEVDYYFDKSIGYYLSYLEYHEEVKQEIEKL